MKVRIESGAYGKPVNAAILVAAILDGHDLRMRGCWAEFEVQDWKEFLHYAYAAMAECSRDSRGRHIGERIPVLVTTDAGNMYRTEVWCDVEAQGVRYVSLY